MIISRSQYGMAAHQLTIEKAKFSAGLFKPDITTVTRDQVTGFLEQLDNTLSRCSPSDIQVWSDCSAQAVT